MGWKETLLNRSDVINIINDNGGTGGGYTKTTWAALVALATREAGQKWNITTANPDDGITYGKVILNTPTTFSYEHTPIDVETIIIN